MKFFLTIIIVLFCLSCFSCFLQPPTKYEYVNITLNNSTSYQIDFYQDNDREVSLDPGKTYSYIEHKNTVASFFAIGDVYTWKNSDSLTSDFNWTLINPVGENITINNNTSNDLIIYINYFDRLLLNASSNQIYNALLGECNLYAMSLNSNEFWELNITLSAGGYIWNINSIDAKTIPINTLRIPIGIWSMYDRFTTDPKNKSILHHLNSNNIINVDVIIINDSGSSSTEMLSGISYNNSEIKISIDSYWDKTEYNLLSVNRGWVLIYYID